MSIGKRRTLSDDWGWGWAWAEPAVPATRVRAAPALVASNVEDEHTLQSRGVSAARRRRAVISGE